MTRHNHSPHGPAAGLWRRAADFAIAASAYACLLYVGTCSLDAVLAALIDEPRLLAVIEHWDDRFLADTCPLGRGFRQLLGGE